MSKQPTCPFCYPSLVVSDTAKFCSNHKSLVNEMASTSLKVALQENRRAIKKGVRGELTLNDVVAARLFFSVNSMEACAYCRSQFKTGLDHWIPLIDGGESIAANVLPCCFTCNTMKGALTGRQFLGVLRDVWKSPVAVEVEENINLYWSLVANGVNAVYDYCATR